MKTLRPKYVKQRGFTLIELMVTVAIFAILVGIGVPAMNNFLNSNRHTAHTSALKQAIQYARSEAVAKNEDVSICASSDGASCTGNWNQGWIVRLVSDGTVLRVWNGLSDNSTLAGQTVSFTSRGESSGAVTFTITDPSGSHVSNLNVNNVGWVTVSRSYDGSSSSSGGTSGGSTSGGSPTEGGN
ncbi:GspH/FimT family pseudopilin [bacterium SCSIO 12696]|nr:GspH/FimT family pseudopilin [bacterium SCSIO 12696]